MTWQINRVKNLRSAFEVYCRVCKKRMNYSPIRPRTVHAKCKKMLGRYENKK